MENGIEKINRILANLSSIQEDMLALKDYIWLNLDHSSVEEVQTAASFQVKYLELLDQFAQNSQEISVLISQFTGIQIEETPKEVEQNNFDNPLPLYLAHTRHFLLLIRFSKHSVPYH